MNFDADLTQNSQDYPDNPGILHKINVHQSLQTVPPNESAFS